MELEPKPVPQEVVDGVREWLGPRGLEFFRGVMRDHGRLDAVYPKRGIPHPVHFREGLHVRNYMRRLTNNAWGPEEYDAAWVETVERAIA